MFFNNVVYGQEKPQLPEKKGELKSKVNCFAVKDYAEFVVHVKREMPVFVGNSLMNGTLEGHELIFSFNPYANTYTIGIEFVGKDRVCVIAEGIGRPFDRELDTGKKSKKKLPEVDV